MLFLRRPWRRWRWGGRTRWKHWQWSKWNSATISTLSTFIPVWRKPFEVKCGQKERFLALCKNASTFQGSELRPPDLPQVCWPCHVLPDPQGQVHCHWAWRLSTTLCAGHICANNSDVFSISNLALPVLFHDGCLLWFSTWAGNGDDARLWHGRLVPVSNGFYEPSRHAELLG